MKSERQAQRTRAYQVGFLMKAYRESFVPGPGRKGLSQEELLRRMADVDAEYAQRFSHTTVSRWESGATRPTIDRLRVFGKALNLSDEEVAGMIYLAGLAVDYQDASDQSVGREASAVAVAPDGEQSESGAAGIQARARSPGV